MAKTYLCWLLSKGDTKVFASAILKIKDEDLKEVLDAKDFGGNTVIFHAAEINKEDIFNLLISSGASAFVMMKEIL